MQTNVIPRQYETDINVDKDAKQSLVTTDLQKIK